MTDKEKLQCWLDKRCYVAKQGEITSECDATSPCPVCSHMSIHFWAEDIISSAHSVLAETLTRQPNYDEVDALYDEIQKFNKQRENK